MFVLSGARRAGYVIIVVTDLASADSAAQFRSNLFELVDSMPMVGSMLSVVWFSITDFKGWSGFVPILIKTLIILASGWLGFLVLRPTSLQSGVSRTGIDQHCYLLLYSQCRYELHD